MYYNISLAQR